MQPKDPTRVLRNVGRRIAELRRAQGRTQEEFAEAAEITVGYVRQLEAGRENLTLTSLARLSDVLEVELEELFKAPRSTAVRRGRPPRSDRE